MSLNDKNDNDIQLQMQRYLIHGIDNKKSNECQPIHFDIVTKLAELQDTINKSLIDKNNILLQFRYRSDLSNDKDDDATGDGDDGSDDIEDRPLRTCKFEIGSQCRGILTIETKYPVKKDEVEGIDDIIFDIVELDETTYNERKLVCIEKKSLVSVAAIKASAAEAEASAISKLTSVCTNSDDQDDDIHGILKLALLTNRMTSFQMSDPIKYVWMETKKFSVLSMTIVFDYMSFS